MTSAGTGRRYSPEKAGGWSVMVAAEKEEEQPLAVVLWAAGQAGKASLTAADDEVLPTESHLLLYTIESNLTIASTFHDVQKPMAVRILDSTMQLLDRLATKVGPLGTRAV